MDRIARSLYGVCPGQGVEVSTLRVCDKPVVARGDIYGGIFEPEAVVGSEPIGRSGHIERAAGDDQVVIYRDAVHEGAVYREAPAPIDRQVVVGEDRPVGSALDRLIAVSFPVGEDILGALRQREEDLVRLADVKCRSGEARHVRSVK